MAPHGESVRRQSIRVWGALTAFALGLAGFQAWPAPVDPRLLVVPFLLAIVGLYRRPGWILGVTVAFLAGCFWQGITALDQLVPVYPKTLQGETVVVTGWVAGPVTGNDRRQRFRFRVHRLHGPEGGERSWDGDLRLSWYGDTPDLAYGQRWRLAVRVRRPRGFRNPGGFDYARYLRVRDFQGTGYVRDEPEPQRLPGLAGPPWRRVLEGLRRDVQSAVGGSALLRALTVGKRDRISEDQWQDLRATGTVHLVAISGLHVGWVAFLLFWLVRRGWARVPPLALRIPAPQVAAVGALVGAVGYAALAGFALPTQRALVMVGAALGAWLVLRPTRFERLLALAAFVVLLWSPGNLREPGFWLSFTAVAAIALVYASGLGDGSRLGRAVAIQIGVVAMVSPWLAYFFGQASLIAPLANAWAIPVFTFLVVPMALVGTLLVMLGFPGAGPIMAGAAKVLDGVGAGLAWQADWPLAQWTGMRPDLPEVVLVLGAGGLALGLRGRRRLWGFAPLLAALAWPGPASPHSGNARIWFLDVGQGNATVVATDRHVAVVDCGPHFGPGFGAGADLVAPFLQARGWSVLDRGIVSHGDDDHSGGCPGLDDAMPVRQWAGDPGGLPQAGRALATGDGWTWDGVSFRVLHPSPGTDLSGNNASRVLAIEAAGLTAVLPGDVERAAERRLLERYPDLDADVVAVPHHGSPTSSTSAWVQALDPQYAVVSVKYRNRWGFPDPKVLARYRSAGGRVLTTPQSGAVRVVLGAEGIGVRPYRPTADHYWNAGLARPYSLRWAAASILGFF